MKQTLVVNFYAGPGSLKSTTAAGVFTLLKLHGVDCELPYEFAKDLIWEENNSMLSDYNYVFGQQSHKIWRLNGKVDVILVDSPLLFSIIYRSESLGVDSIKHMVSTYNSYNNLDIYLKRNMSIEYNENGREQNLKEAIKIDNKVLETLNQYCTPYYIMPAGVNSINNITDLVCTKLNLKLKYKLEELE